MIGPETSFKVITYILLFVAMVVAAKFVDGADAAECTRYSQSKTRLVKDIPVTNSLAGNRLGVGVAAIPLNGVRATVCASATVNIPEHEPMYMYYYLAIHDSVSGMRIPLHHRSPLVEGGLNLTDTCGNFEWPGGDAMVSLNMWAKPEYTSGYPKKLHVVAQPFNMTAITHYECD